MLLEVVGNSAKCIAAVSTGALHLHCSGDPDLNCTKPPCNLELAKLSALAQVHMLFRVKVSSKADGRYQSMHMLLVRYYDACPLEDYDRDVDLSLRHLVWEGSAKISKKTKWHPHYAVVDCRAVIRQACICPHFQKWDEGQRRYFLVNDLLTLWPNADMLPQQPFVHHGDPVAS